MLGMHGTYWANMAIHNADLVFAIGPRFDDRVTGRVADFIPHAKVIHIDIDPTSIRKNVNVDIPIVGDAKCVLKDLNQLLRAHGNGDLKAMRRPWFEQIEEWKREHPLTYNQGPDIIKPQYVIEKLYEVTRGNAIIVTEVGQHQMWAAQFFLSNRARTFITSGGLGTMGFGFPAALGAQKAFPDQLVIDIAGDGSFQMNLQELATATDHNLPVKVAIVNNHYHGMVRQWQQLFYRGRYSSSYLGNWPDYVKLAEAFGAVGLRATKPQEVVGVIEEALKIKKPVLMDFHVDPMENCYPMIPAGAAIHEMVFSDPEPQEKEKEKLPATGNKEESILTS
jgi:acetolactate synthase-1/2/3 large subunit